MSEGAKVVSMRSARRFRDREAGDELKQRIQLLEEELARARAEAQSLESGHEGALVALAKLLQEGWRGVNWDNVASVWSSVYFTFHDDDVDDFGYDRKFTQTILPLFEFLYAVWWRVETAGVENVPGQGPALLVANHSGVLPYDGVMIHLAMRHEHPERRECRMLALDMFALLPFLAQVLSRTGAVRANPENAERLLRRGALVGVFPEGIKGVGKPFRNRYKLARFGRGGFVRIALRTGAPIVPCAVVGAEEIHPMLANLSVVGKPFGFPYFPVTPTFPMLGALGLVPLPSKWSLEFGEPLPTQGYGPEAADDPILVNRLSEQVRSTIQRMIDGRLARRRSVWFG